MLIYFIISLYYLETLFRVLTSGKVVTLGSYYSLIFDLPIALGCYLVSCLLPVTMQKPIECILLGVVTLIFMSQYIYFKIFRMFYSWYSTTKIGRVMEFWEIIVMQLKTNCIGLILLAIPFICQCILINTLQIQDTFTKGITLLAMIVGHLIGLLSLFLTGKAMYTPYDLYFKHNYPVVAVEKLGLLTTLRLDAKRGFTKWSPTLAETHQKITLIHREETLLNRGDTYTEETLLNQDTEETLLNQDANEMNVLNIDFNTCIQKAPNEEIAKMHRYFKTQQPSAKNAYTGKYKGYNLICITAESFSPYAIREDLTPTLYKIATQGYQFTNFYTPIWEVSTSDGEYTICTGQIPQTGTWSMATSHNRTLPFTLGNQLKKQGYETWAFHNHTYHYYDRHLSHPNMGYQYKAKGLGLEITNTWPESDVEMMLQTVPYYSQHEPFHVYYMTVSGHMNYSFRENAISRKNADLVAHLKMSPTVKAYLACQIELDRAVEKLMAQLETDGVLDRTLIMITPDHYPYGLNREYMCELAGKELEEQFELYRSALLLYTPNMKPMRIDKPCSSLDILPTLSNLMGLDFDSRFMMGRDIFSSSPALVLFYSHSFITDKGCYNALTNTFLCNPNVVVDEDYVRHWMDVADAKFYYSTKVLDLNYFETLV